MPDARRLLHRCPVLAQGYFFIAQGFFAAQGFALGAQGFALHGFAARLADLCLGAQGLEPAAAGTGVAATMPVTAAIVPRVCSDFLSVDIPYLLGLKFRRLHRRVVTFTSQSGMAAVREASTILSRPVSTKSPMPKKAAPISGFPMRDARAIQSLRAMIAWREP